MQIAIDSGCDKLGSRRAELQVAISANYIHLAQLQMNDGGCHYHLLANPGTTVTQNYCDGEGSGTSGTMTSGTPKRFAIAELLGDTHKWTYCALCEQVLAIKAEF